MDTNLLTRPMRAIVSLIAAFYVLATFVCSAQRPIQLPYGLMDLKNDTSSAPKEATPLPIRFKHEGIEYRVVSEDDKTVRVIRGTDDTLKSIVIPEYVTYNNQQYAVKEISSHAFADMEMVSITIPNTVTSIGSSAFFLCSNLASIIIPDSVTTIGLDVFSDCTSLTTITIPKSVISIGSGSFDHCTALRSINVEPGNKNYTSVDGILFNKSETELVAYPPGRTGNYSIPESVTSIGELAFSGCTGLTSITIPPSVTSIGAEAFCNCKSLTSISIPSSVTSIGPHAFYYCKGLTSVSIPSSVTSISVCMFLDCTSLLSITIPSSVTSIGASAFSGCSSITSITIPHSITSIGSGAFEFCSSITSITIPPSVTSIDHRAFAGCTGLKRLTIPQSVTYIGLGAFESCSLNPLLILTKNCEFGTRVIGVKRNTIIKAYDIDPIRKQLEWLSYSGYTVEFMPPENE